MRGVYFEELQSRSKISEIRDKGYDPHAHYAVQVIFMGIESGNSGGLCEVCVSVCGAGGGVKW